MATLQSASSSHYEPAKARSRRSSSRMSFASSVSRSASYLESPRTACPKDGNAFSYNPAHLHAWYLPQHIWDHLPAPLHATLVSVQHSGAAVLTGFDRLDRHSLDVDGSHIDYKTAHDELVVQLDDLPPPKFRTISNASSCYQSDLSSSQAAESPTSHTAPASPATSFGFSFSSATSPTPSVSLGPPELCDKRDRSRERSFSVPLEPHDAYFATELSHLRTEALPRLRHMCHKVDTEWYEAKRTGSMDGELANAFENWWAEKKCNVLSLNDRCQRLATAHGLANTGMGWRVV